MPRGCTTSGCPSWCVSSRPWRRTTRRHWKNCARWATRSSACPAHRATPTRSASIYALTATRAPPTAAAAAGLRATDDCPASGGRLFSPLPAGERGRAYASRFLRLTAHLEDFFEKSSVRGGGDPLAGNAHLGRMLFEQAQGDPPQHGEVLGPASALQPTGILAEVDVHVPV